MKDNKTLHYIFPLTGPNNGVKVLSLLILEELFKNASIPIRKVDTAQAKDHSNFGKFSIGKVLRSFKLFAQVLKIKSKDLVYINLTPRGFAYYRDLTLLLLCKLKTKNITIHVHANDLEKRINPVSLQILKNTKIIVINKNQEHKLKPHVKHLFRVANSLPDFYKEDFKLPKRDQNHTLSLIFLSNLSIEKGIDRLAVIAETIKQKNLKAILNIYGGALTRFEKEKITRLKTNYEFVNYFGPVTEDALKHKALRDNDALLFLSEENYEVYPLVYIESIMNGLPIITTKQIVSPSLKKESLVFELDKDLDNFAELFNMLYAEILQDDLLKNKIRNTYKERYSFNGFIAQLEHIILYDI